MRASKQLRIRILPPTAAALWVAAFSVQADPVVTSATNPPAKPMEHVPASTGPVVSPPTASPDAALSGQGYWRFEAADPALMPVPAEARPAVKGAHGTLIVDQENDRVFWGLENVGWIEFREGLTRSRVITGDPAFAKGNLHGADLLPRADQPPLVAVADNVEGEVYLSDTSFRQANVLPWPSEGPYQARNQYHPTDVAFVGEDHVVVTDGYGKAHFMAATTEPLAFEGVFLGGKSHSKTPHGITLDPADGSWVISARPEGLLKRWSSDQGDWLEVLGLPAGSTVCDVDLWGTLALAPCLNGPDGTPGPIYVVDLERNVIRSVLKPKEDLDFPDAQHIHDAAWYVRGAGADREVFVLFTSWNPGGVGALKLVQAN